MIDYVDYTIITSYMRQNDMDSLKRYLEEEKHKYYLKEARESLEKYLRGYRNSFIEYVSENRVLISDGCTGGLILNNGEIISNEIKKEFLGRNSFDANDLKDESIKIIFERCDNLDKIAKIEVYGIVPDTKPGTIKVYNSSGKELHAFQKSIYEEYKNILGEDTKFKTNSDKNKPILTAKSSKGRAFVLGIR